MMNTEAETELMDHMENLFVPQTAELAIAVIKNLGPVDGFRCLEELLVMLVDETNHFSKQFIDGDTGRDPIKEGTTFRDVGIASADLAAIVMMKNIASTVRVWREVDYRDT